ncbi:Putative RND family efflux transporter MFP subunit [Candidatus Phycorickettsia trachydisci]|uniref:RND family efflux transporter MFP subunit n=1 Tax=Candidatus Phycorickettsia trachydisci TaxID=2115978 RepID=A0A2P1P8H5_9RICK|nr:efflux RND transporter periplasmic adaptor subunit [Candidatus Phycorickettsia trachydisci]AVP87545.1 Putative RND family efflux transporter MFP subunit [Candidatus Phycorickettsia trachydisci]
MRFITYLILLIFSSHSFAITIPVKTATCQTKEVYDSYNAIGKLKAAKRQDFFISIAGTVDFVSDKQGQVVESGEVVFAVDKSLAESIKQHAVDNYEEANLSLKRSQVLYNKKLISDDALDQAKLKVSNTKSALEQANKTYKNMVFIAPFKGKLGGIDYLPGNYVTPGPEPVCSIIDESAGKQITFYLPEELINKLDDTAEVNLKLNDKIYPAKIISKSPYLSPNNGGFLVSTSTDSNVDIPDNATVLGEFRFSKHKALVIPEEALGKGSQGDFIYLVTDDSAHKIIVQTGFRNDGFVEIAANELSEGSIVISGGMNKLSDKSKVKVIPNDK